MARGLKFRIKKVVGLNYLCSKNKGTDQARDNAKLICDFVFAYAKNRFSHDAAHIIRATCGHSTLVMNTNYNTT